MVEIKRIVYTEKFERDVKKVRDSLLKEGVKDQVRKIAETPQVGKRLQYELKGERTVRINPYGLIYSVQGDTLILLRFEHRKNVDD
jgi:mRNA-degrading endonuclease RelE of RelBE toxin-antitoxin system